MIEVIVNILFSAIVSATITMMILYIYSEIKGGNKCK